MTKIKICGLKRPEDIMMANAYEPDYVGFIVDFPKSHRSLTPDRVERLVKNLNRERIKAVGVFVDEPIETVIRMLKSDIIDIAQLHGHEDEAYIGQVQSETEKPVVKAFAIKDESVLEQAAKSSADHILLDQGQGQGKTFDWSLLGSEAAKAAFGKEGIPSGKWFLAGGLDADNIEDAIERFHPFAVDLSSAVETDKMKDEDKVRRVIEIVRNRR